MKIIWTYITSKISRVDLYVVGAFALFFLLFYGIQLFSREVPIYRDLGDLLLGIEQAVRHTEFPPLWNPWVVLGRPLAADILNGVYYLPLIILRFLPIPEAFTLGLIFHHLLAAVGIYLLLRMYSVARIGAVAAGVVYAVGGYAMSGDAFPNALQSTAWLPWMVAALVYWFRSRRIVSLIGLVMAILLCVLGGMPEVAVLFILLAPAVIAQCERKQCEQKQESADLSTRTHDLRTLYGGVCAASCAAFLLGAVQFFPLIAYLKDSSRSSGLTAQTVLRYSVPPLRLFELVIAPSSKEGMSTPCTHTTLRESLCAEEQWAYSLYVGPAIFLTLFALTLYPLRRLKIFLAVGLGSVVLSLGSYLPGVQSLVSWVPLLQVFRYPEKLLLVPHILVSVGAGIAIGKVSQATPSSSRMLRMMLFFWALAVCAGSALLGFSEDSWVLAGAVRFLPLFFIYLVLFAWGEKRPQALAVALLMMLAGDLATAHYRRLPSVEWGELLKPPRWVAQSRKESETPITRAYANTIGVGNVRSAQAELEIKRELLFMGLSMLYLVPNLNTPSSITSSRDEALMKFIESLPRERVAPYLASIGVSHVSSAVQLRFPSFTPFANPPAHPGLTVYRIELPQKNRVGLVSIPSQVRGEEDSDAVREVMADSRYNPQTTALSTRPLLVGEGEVLVDAKTPQEGYFSNSFEFSVLMKKQGLVTLAVGAYPGWQWYVDGEATTPTEISQFIQGAVIEKGKHTVIAKYEPLSYRLGVAWSLLTALLLVTGVVYVYRRKLHEYTQKFIAKKISL